MPILHLILGHSLLKTVLHAIYVMFYMFHIRRRMDIQMLYFSACVAPSESPPMI